MTWSRRLSLIVAVVAATLAAVTGAYLRAWDRAEAESRDNGMRRVAGMARDLELALAKFDTLPYLAALQAEAARALDNPGERQAIDAANRILQAIGTQAGVAAIYLMDRSGTTLASSNWDQAHSFVGRSFGFRPYFLEAMRGGSGYFYGIGSTTGEPGYFIAQPVYRRDPAADPEPLGVVAVKISLSDFEASWRDSAEPIALADRHGVIFLSNRGAWKYHSFDSLSTEAHHSLAVTLQYAGRAIAPVDALAPAERPSRSNRLGQRLGPLDWQLMLFNSPEQARAAAFQAALATALAVFAALLGAWAAYLRRRRIEEARASRAALHRAAEDLERRIAQRTQDMASANRDLADKLAALQTAQQLLRSTQDELVQAGKLAMLGQMAAGVTHELNQPLAAIRAFADNGAVLLGRGQVPQAADNFTQISSVSAHMGAIIAQLKGFARKSGSAVAPVDLRQAMAASARLLDNDFRRGGVVLETAADAPLCILGDPVRVEQVLINLLRNAFDASEGAAERHVSMVLDREGDDAVLRVRDSGPGIPEDVAAHLFEPFFTTKEAGRGLGLGLAISSSIVQAMNGQLSARNHPAGGAEFIVRLPLPATAAAGGRADTPCTAGNAARL